MNLSKLSTNPTISIVIPVLNAAQYIQKLLESLQQQKPFPPNEIIIVDSGSTDDTVDIASSFSTVKIVHIKKFSHGRSRNLGAKYATGGIVVLLTQDALPRDTDWLKNLINPFSDKRVAATYSRQIPHQNAQYTECFFLKKRFPDGPKIIRRKEHSGEILTFDKVFFSNVSSAIRRNLLVQYPFDEELIMCEDQQLSRDLLNAGYSIVYVPDSAVIHSHDYSLTQTFKRYFDSVVALSEIFPHSAKKKDSRVRLKYIFDEIKYVIINHPREIPYLILFTITRSTAILLGRFVNIIPKPILRRISMHNYHWK